MTDPRVSLAAERTLLAWIRTGLAMRYPEPPARCNQRASVARSPTNNAISR